MTPASNTRKLYGRHNDTRKLYGRHNDTRKLYGKHNDTCKLYRRKELNGQNLNFYRLLTL